MSKKTKNPQKVKIHNRYVVKNPELNWVKRIHTVAISGHAGILAFLGANFEKGKGIEQLQANILYFWPFMVGAILILLSMVFCASIQMDNDTKNSFNTGVEAMRSSNEQNFEAQEIQRAASVITKYVGESSIKTGRFISIFLVVSGLLFFFGIFQLSFGAISFSKLC